MLVFEVVDLPGKPALLRLPNSVCLSLLSFNNKVSTNTSGSVSPESFSTMSGALTMPYLLETRKSTFEGLGCLGQPISFLLDLHVKPVHAPVHHIPVTKQDGLNSSWRKWLMLESWRKRNSLRTDAQT